MLWADDRSSLPNNYFSALEQLNSLEHRLDKNSELKNNYARTITRDFDKGYIVQVNKWGCFKVVCSREWYLRHHPAFHPHKPGKVRHVHLIHVLFRFRQYQYAVFANTEGMFLKVGVIPQDQTSLRFL